MIYLNLISANDHPYHTSLPHIQVNVVGLNESGDVEGRQYHREEKIKDGLSSQEDTFDICTTRKHVTALVAFFNQFLKVKLNLAEIKLGIYTEK